MVAPAKHPITKGTADLLPLISVSEKMLVRARAVNAVLAIFVSRGKQCDENAATAPHAALVSKDVCAP
jgi:hypothetical protein